MISQQILVFNWHRDIWYAMILETRHKNAYSILNLSWRWGQNIPGELDQSHGPLTRYVKLRVAHAPGMMGTFSPPPRVSDPDMHHGTCVTHVPCWMPGSLTTGFLWIPWRGKHSRRMRNLQFCLYGKRRMVANTLAPRVAGSLSCMMS